MFSKLFSTDNSYTWFLLRVVLGFVMLGHGVQKAFGWFGGFGWTNSVNYFTDSVGLPGVLAALVILIESLGAFLLILGVAGRINAALLGIVMTSAMIIDHSKYGFYMNWFNNQKGEGIEFALLFIAISIGVVINGSGKFSVDRLLVNSNPGRSFQPA